MAKNKTHHGIAEVYKFYQSNSDAPLEYSMFGKIYKAFFAEISRIIIYEAFEFRVPHRLGRLRIRKYKPKVKVNSDGTLDKSRLRPNWGKTNALWARSEEAKKNKQLVYHTNDHSDGYQHRFFWEKRMMNVPNYSAYSFIPARANKRELAAVLKDEDNFIDYFE